MDFTVCEDRSISDDATLAENAFGQLAAFADDYAVHEKALRELGSFFDLTTGSDDTFLDGGLFFHGDVLANQAVGLGDGGA